MIISEKLFKNKPILTFQKDEKDRYPVAFGMRKCKVILENMGAIQNFFEKHKNDDTTPETAEKVGGTE